jgi:hypothetical protein
MSVLAEQLNLSQSQFAELMEEFKTGIHMGAVNSELNQRDLREDNLKDHKAVEGLGRLVGCIDLNAWTKMSADGQRWQDPDFLPWFLKTHPDSQVKCGGTKIQKGFETESNWIPEKKFTKKYDI